MQIPDARLAGFLAALASGRPSPGAGAAAGVALALAAACAAKALRISARHHPGAGLELAADEAEGLAGAALNAAQKDSEDFPAFLASQQSPQARETLIADGARLLKAAARLAELVAAHGEAVTPALQGDLAAACDLLAAAEQICRRNLAELAADEG